MAQGEADDTAGVTHRRVVLDANILIRGVLGTRVPNLIAARVEVELFAPETAFAEAGRYLPALAATRGADPREWLESLARLRALVVPVPDSALEPQRGAALSRIGDRDRDDWPVVAAALALDCPIWTEDRDFFGVGIATWTTSRIETYLRGD